MCSELLAKDVPNDEARPFCKYGAACYRKNPQHLLEFAHPHLDCQRSCRSFSRRSTSDLSMARGRDGSPTSSDVTSDDDAICVDAETVTGQ